MKTLKKKLFHWMEKFLAKHDAGRFKNMNISAKKIEFDLERYVTDDQKWHMVEAYTTCWIKRDGKTATSIQSVKLAIDQEVQSSWCLEESKPNSVL